MTTTTTGTTGTGPPAVDADRLDALLGRFVGDLGATVGAAGIVIGHRLGLFRALAEGPATAEQLADRTGTEPRRVTEWLRLQAAGGYVVHDDGVFSMDAEQALALTDPEGPLYLPGAFVLALGALRAEPRVTESFRTGAGMGWHEHHDDVFDGCESFFRPGYATHLLSSWLPALDGVVDRLTSGGTVADVGCGHGSSTVLLARAFPRTVVHGSDYHAGSVDVARRRAGEAGVAGNTRFEVAGAEAFGGGGYDLVTFFDCLHDMGDPLGAARHVRSALGPDGTWMIVEPRAEDDPAGNLNPVGRLFYGFSTLICVPNATSQPGGYSLGAQAGEEAVRRIAAEAGFTRFERVAETPFNAVYAARP